MRRTILVTTTKGDSLSTSKMEISTDGEYEALKDALEEMHDTGHINRYALKTLSKDDELEYKTKKLFRELMVRNQYLDPNVDDIYNFAKKIIEEESRLFNKHKI